MDRWMHEDPKLYKYECTKHDTCKKYFKKAYSLRKHLKRMGDKDYPTNISRFFRPEIPPDQETIKDYELPPTPPPRNTKECDPSEHVEAKKRKRKVVKRKDRTNKDEINTEAVTIAHVTPIAQSTVSIAQNKVALDLKSELHSSTSISETSKNTTGKRGRKRKDQTIAVVQVPSQQSPSSSNPISQMTTPVVVTSKDGKTIRPTLLTAYAPQGLHNSGIVTTPGNAIIVHAEGVKVEMDSAQPQQNSLPIVLNRSIDATATLDTTSVIPIQHHSNQIFHQIQIQQPQPQIHQTQQVIQQHTQGTSASNQPITEHVWVSGHQVFYNTR